VKPTNPRKLTGPLRFAKAIGAAPLGRSHKAILTAYIERVNYTTWEAWPSVSDLAKRSGCGRRTVQQGLRDLSTLGALAFLNRSAGGIGRNGKGKTHHVRINIEGLEAMNGADQHQLPDPSPPPATAQNRTEKGAPPPPNGAGQHQEHTNQTHQERQQTIHVSGTPTPTAGCRADGMGAALGSDGWMGTTTTTTDVKAALRACGVQGPTLNTLAAMPGLTADRVFAEWRTLKADPNVRNAAAVLVKRFSDEMGVVLGSRGRVSAQAFESIGKIEELRRKRRGPSGSWGYG
jgi:hypothetical protein